MSSDVKTTTTGAAADTDSVSSPSSSSSSSPSNGSATTSPRKAKHFVIKKTWWKEILIYIWQSLIDLWQWGTWGDPCRFQAPLKHLMEIFDDLMKQQGLGNEYWLDYGCMLGALRHGRLIPWDHDLDVGITTKGYNKCMELMRANHPLPPGIVWYYNEESKYLQIRTVKGPHFKYEVWVDIVEYAHNEKIDSLQPKLHEFYDDPENREEYCPPIPREFILPLRHGGTRGRLWEREYPMPIDADSYLRIVYGEYWKIRIIPFIIFALWHPIQAIQFLGHYIPAYRNRHKAEAAAKLKST
jgi:hypothetical protein